MVDSGYLRSQIPDEIEALLDDPYPVGSDMEDDLVQRQPLKIAGWRIIYEVDEADKVITILAIRRRNRNTYLYVS